MTDAIRLCYTQSVSTDAETEMAVVTQFFPSLMQAPCQPVCVIPNQCSGKSL